MDTYLKTLRKAHPTTSIAFFQSNHEGALIDYLQQPELVKSQGVIINPGALAHTSYALADAVGELEVPVIELHISNIYAREPWRRHSVLSERVQGVVTGLGIQGHALAVGYLLGMP